MFKYHILFHFNILFYRDGCDERDERNTVILLPTTTLPKGKGAGC